MLKLIMEEIHSLQGRVEEGKWLLSFVAKLLASVLSLEEMDTSFTTIKEQLDALGDDNNDL